MKKNYLLILMMTFLTSAVFAQTTTIWNPAANASSTGLWSEAANWTTGIVPEGDYKVVFNVPAAQECVLDDAHSITQIVMGDGAAGETLRVANGGTLTTGVVWSAIGYNSTATMVVDTGGVVNFGEHLWVGWDPGSDAVVELNGGTINVAQMTGLGWNGGKGAIYVKSGFLNLGNLDPVASIKDGFIEISAGVMTIIGDKVTAVNDYITAGKITATGGSGDFVINYDDVADLTTVYQIPARQETTIWNPGGNAITTGLWTEAANWTDGRTPLDNKVVFNVAGAVECVLDDTSNIFWLVMGDGGDGGTLRIADGGVLTTGTVWSGIAWSHEATLIVDAGGTVNFGEHLWVGWAGDALVEISGVVNVAQMYGTDFEGIGGGSGETYVKLGGVLNLNGLHPTQSIPDGSLLDVSGGTITIVGDQTGNVQVYADLGLITAEYGAEDITMVYDADADLTIITSSTTVAVDNNIVARSIGIYPNPATDVIYLMDNVAADVTIYSVNGQLVLTELNTSMVNVQDLKPGYYFVKVNSNGNIQVDKLIIE